MSQLVHSKLEDIVAYLWHSDASDEFEKMIDILSLLIPMFPLLFISHCLLALQGWTDGVDTPHNTFIL